MANQEHLDLLRRGVDVWNEWRKKEPSKIMDLSGEDLRDTKLAEANFSGANLSEADLSGADVGGATLRFANLINAKLVQTDFCDADLSGADLSGATLAMANLFGADLTEANLSEANLGGAILVRTDLTNAVLNGCRVYGISAWDVKLTGTKQQDLVITAFGEPEIAVDDIEVAQFVYLLLHNEKIRNVIDTIGRKGVLLLGRFTEGRIAVLERLREELRKRGYLPIVFNFDKPETKTFTETVRVLAGLSRFVIAEITDPRSVPAELQAAVPAVMVPFLPILKEGEKPFALLEALWAEHSDRVFAPVEYSSLDALIAALDEKIIRPAEARFAELLKRKAERMGGEHV